MHKINILLVYLIFPILLNGQALIARHSASGINFYTTLNTAIAASVNGDTLYLPGKNFPGFTLNKSITILGAGYDLDSTVSTGRTYISGTSFILNTASGGSIEGIRFYNLYFGTNASNQVVNNFTVKKCYIENYFELSYLTSGNNLLANSNIISQNIIYSFHGGGSFNNIITNNLIYNYLAYLGENSLIANNIFASNYTALLTDIIGCEIQNNIFLYVGSSGLITYSNFQNNIRIPGVDFVANFGITNTSSGNFLGVDESSLFVNYTYGPMGNYNLQNFRLADDSPYSGAGYDGTDIGIYGGTFPWQDGGVPHNPHISSKTIPSVSDNDGTLDIEIKVNAQDN